MGKFRLVLDLEMEVKDSSRAIVGQLLSFVSRSIERGKVTGPLNSYITGWSAEVFPGQQMAPVDHLVSACEAIVNLIDQDQADTIGDHDRKYLVEAIHQAYPDWVPEQEEEQ